MARHEFHNLKKKTIFSKTHNMYTICRFCISLTSLALNSVMTPFTNAFNIALLGSLQVYSSRIAFNIFLKQWTSVAHSYFWSESNSSFIRANRSKIGEHFVCIFAQLLPYYIEIQVKCNNSVLHIQYVLHRFQSWDLIFRSFPKFL